MEVLLWATLGCSVARCWTTHPAQEWSRVSGSRLETVLKKRLTGEEVLLESFLKKPALKSLVGWKAGATRKQFCVRSKRIQQVAHHVFRRHSLFVQVKNEIRKRFAEVEGEGARSCLHKV